MLRSLALGARRPDRRGGWSAPGRSYVWLTERRQLRQDHCWGRHRSARASRDPESEGERRRAKKRFRRPARRVQLADFDEGQRGPPRSRGRIIECRRPVAGGPLLPLGAPNQSGCPTPATSRCDPSTWQNEPLPRPPPRRQASQPGPLPPGPLRKTNRGVLTSSGDRSKR